MCLLGSARRNDGKSRKKKELGGEDVSSDLSFQSKDMYVRIVHAGGRVELYQNVVPASQLMEKYPGLCVARPEIFKNLHKSLLLPEEELLPGQKYYLIPSTTARKINQKHTEKVKVKETTGYKEAKSKGGMTPNAAEGNLLKPFSSAKEFYASKEKVIRKRNGRMKKPFVPPLPRTKTFRVLDWEPSLTSVQEISP